MRKYMILVFICNFYVINTYSYNANQGEVVLPLTKVKLINNQIIKEIKKNLKDIKEEYKITESCDTFLVNFYNMNTIPFFAVIAKNGKKICKYEISENEVLGYCLVKNNIFIICGEAFNQIKSLKKDEIKLILYDFPPTIDGYPPCWIFKIDSDSIKLVEKYVPKEEHYHVKFP